MPITFAPASPFNAKAFADSASGQTRDRQDALRAQQQADAARNYAQASIASAGNLTRASETDAELDARRIALDRQIDFQRQGQLREFEAQRQQQQRAQQFEMAKMNIAITKQEQDEQTRRVNGLASIQRQVHEGLLTPEQAGDAEYELVTGINAFQRRQQFQQSRAMEQQAEMRQREVADYQKQAATSEKFMLDMALKGITVQPFLNPETGRQSFIAYDQKTGRLYNPLLEHAGKGGDEKPPGGEWSHLASKTGTFDEAAALKDAKAYAEGQLPKVSGTEGKDKNEAARAELIKDRIDGMRREFREAAQKAPVTAPTAGQAEQAPSPPQPVQAPPQQGPKRGVAVLAEVNARDAAGTVEPIRQQVTAKFANDPAKKKQADDLLGRLQTIMSRPDFGSPTNLPLWEEYETVRAALKKL